MQCALCQENVKQCPFKELNACTEEVIPPETMANPAEGII
jgi:hypothetical protein